MMLILPSGLGVGDVVYFNVSILNDEAVEEMFENFTVHLNDTARVSVIGTRYAVVDIEEDETDGEFNLFIPSLCIHSQQLWYTCVCLHT